LISCPAAHRSLHSFPTRRSSDLLIANGDPLMGQVPLPRTDGSDGHLIGSAVRAQVPLGGERVERQKFAGTVGGDDLCLEVDRVLDGEGVLLGLVHVIGLLLFFLFGAGRSLLPASWFLL